MSRAHRFDQWLKDDHHQLEWTADYFKRVLGLTASNPPTRQELISLSTLREGLKPKGEQLEAMRAAWNTYHHQSTKKRARRSYDLSVTSIKHLTVLSKQHQMPLGRIVEALIDRGFEFEQEERRKYSEATKSKTAELERLYQKRHQVQASKNRKLLTVNQLQTKLEVVEKLLNKWILEACKRQVIMDAMGVKGLDISPEQEPKLAELLEQREKILKYEVEDAMNTELLNSYVLPKPR